MRKIFLKVVSVIFAIIFTISIALTVLVFSFNGKIRSDEDIVPIESITGINTPATLKDGCYIKHGVIFHDGIGFYNGFIEVLPGDEQEGLPVSSVRIIDVYETSCTIYFESGGESYIEDNYPLSNLRYNVIKVLLADDGVHSSYYGQRIGVKTAHLYLGTNPLNIDSLVAIDITCAIILTFMIVRKVKNIRSEQK
ncbi:MAG: hypothetical protein K6F49_07755 [Saccharofermentans sp.]|nr:hypothetical protein [Saccharofermentans sp.]